MEPDLIQKRVLVEEVEYFKSTDKKKALNKYYLLVFQLSITILTLIKFDLTKLYGGYIFVPSLFIGNVRFF